MSDSFCSKKRYTRSSMCFTNLSKSNLSTEEVDCSPVLPGLPDDVSKYCLALVPRSHYPAMGGVCKKWRNFIESKEFVTIRKLAGKLEEFLYVLTNESDGDESHWEVLDSMGQKDRDLPLMPGPVKADFGVTVINGKFLVIGGYCSIDGERSASSDVYQYDPCLNRWSKLGNMNIGRYDFACTELNGIVYAVGGYGENGESLSSVEAYNPDDDKWTIIESLRRPRWGCFGCSLDGQLYIMGGRSSFTIGNSKFIDVYNPETHSWSEMRNGCVMVISHAVLGKKLFCMEWKNQRKLAVFHPEDCSWKMVPIPVTGSSSIGFRFGILDGKLLLLSLKEDPGYNHTLSYDPNAPLGKEWQPCKIKSSGLCLCTVTIMT